MQHTGHLYTLLIITASPAETRKLCTLLKEEQINIVTASDTSALQISQLKPDLILLNPEQRSSAECYSIRNIRENSHTRTTPIIFISTIDNENVITECLNYQYTDFIAKPLREKELILRVRHQLSLLNAKRTIRKQNEYLKQTIAARDKLYSVIAHDLRSPIGTIKMINAAIENEKESITDPGIRQKFEMINETTEEAFNLLENLLRWSRNQTGKTKVIAADFSITLAVRQVLSLFTSIALAKEIRLNNHIRQSHWVYADEDMVKTVLRNLISNAIKFSYSQGTIDIFATEKDEQITIGVKDQGPGITPENQEKLQKGTESFTTYGTHNEKGSGLGLLLCRDFIKRNKGKFYFTSQVGQGSVFYFTLPKGENSVKENSSVLSTKN